MKNHLLPIEGGASRVSRKRGGVMLVQLHWQNRDNLDETDFIGEIIRRPCKGVDGGDGFTQGCGQQQGGNRKVFVMCNSHNGMKYRRAGEKN